MINVKQLYNLIERTLKEYDLYSENASKLLLGTYLQESTVKGQTCLRQLPKGEFDMKIHALGIFQMEFSTFDWLKGKYDGNFRYPFTYGEVQFEELEYNLKYAILFCRLRYLADPKPIPDNLEGLANYWKRVYNTSSGSGTPEEFFNKYEKYAKGVIDWSDLDV